jgi:hypothetical protein
MSTTVFYMDTNYSGNKGIWPRINELHELEQRFVLIRVIRDKIPKA